MEGASTEAAAKVKRRGPASAVHQQGKAAMDFVDSEDSLGDGSELSLLSSRRLHTTLQVRLKAPCPQGR
jgi:hypothetical protein